MIHIEQIVGAAEAGIDIAVLLDDRQLAVDVCDTASAALTAEAGVRERCAARMELAQHLHRVGWCDEALAEAACALGAYQVVGTGRDAAAVTLFLAAAGMFDGCHRHTEARTLDLPFDGQHFNDQPGVLDAWAAKFDETRLAVLEHTRAFHASPACADVRCRMSLVVAADIEHQRVLYRVMPLYEAHQDTKAGEAVRAYLAGLDPETCPPSDELGRLAALHLADALADAPRVPDASVLRWGRYARRAGAALDPARHVGWGELATMFAQVATLCGAHNEAIAAAGEVYDVHLCRGDTLAAIDARFELATALHAAGHCIAAREHATAAWTGTRRHLDPTDPSQQCTGWIAGTNVIAMLNDCHQHTAASTVFDDLVATYREPAHRTGGTPFASDGTTGHQQRCTDAARRQLLRSLHHHATYHAEDPCLRQCNHDAARAAALADLGHAAPEQP